MLHFEGVALLKDTSFSQRILFMHITCRGVVGNVHILPQSRCEASPSAVGRLLGYVSGVFFLGLEKSFWGAKRWKSPEFRYFSKRSFGGNPYFLKET